VAPVTTATTRRRNARLLRWGVLLIVGLVFAIPLYSMFRYSTRITPQNPSTWDSWRAIVQDSQLRGAILTSLKLAALTVLGMLVLLVPTMIWIRIKVPWANRLVEFLCLLPLTIPAIVLVVGLGNVMSWVNYLVTNGPLALTFPYIILVLPFCYRALDAGLSAIDVRTLSEAARSLGAGWWTVIVRVIVPNMWNAVLSAAFLAVAVVLGEFTIASLFFYDNMQVVIALLGLENSNVSVATSLAALMFGVVLLFAMSFVGRRPHQEVAP
jgi:putative spermidine/putrescine transport system permease protein